MEGVVGGGRVFDHKVREVKVGEVEAEEGGDLNVDLSCFLEVVTGFLEALLLHLNQPDLVEHSCLVHLSLQLCQQTNRLRLHPILQSFLNILAVVVKTAEIRQPRSIRVTINSKALSGHFEIL